MTLAPSSGAGGSTKFNEEQKKITLDHMGVSIFFYEICFKNSEND